MDVTEFETELVELAVRRVATPEGASFYGLPIGSPITPDVIAAKKAEAAGKGLKPPTGGLSAGSKGSGHLAGTISGKAAAAKNAPAPSAPTKLNLKVTKSTISGNKHFSVGGAKYTAPNNSKLIKPINADGLAYVVTPDGEVHAFSDQGEIVIPDVLQTVFATKFSGDLTGDTKYAEADFDSTSSSFGIEELPIGATLTDKDGNPQFKKTGKSDWEQVDLGIPLDEADIKPLYDSGELLPEKTPESEAAAQTFDNTPATNFSEMSTDEVKTALDAYPTGQVLTMGKKNAVTVVKNDDGTWTSDFAPQSKIASGSLALSKNILRVGQDEKKSNPLEGNPLNPEDKPQLTKGDSPTSDWVDKAPTGAEMVFKSLSGDGRTTWTKQDDQSWVNQNGGEMSAKLMADNMKLVGKNLKITNDGTSPKTDSIGGDKTPPTPPAADARSTEPTPRSSSDLTPGEGDYTDMATGDEVDNAVTGNKMLVSFDNGNMVSEYELADNGAWGNVDDPTESLGHVTMKAMADNAGAEQVYKNKTNAGPERTSKKRATKKPKAVPAEHTDPNTTDVLWSADMTPLDISSSDNPNALYPGDYDFAAETSDKDIIAAQTGDKILVGYDPDFGDSDEDLPHYQADDLLEKQSDGSWKSLTGSKDDVTEDELLAWNSPAPGDNAQQLYTFKGNSTQAGSDSKLGVSQEAKGAQDGSGNGLAEGNSVPTGSGGVAEKSQSGLGGLDGPGHSDGNGVGVELANGHKPPLLNGGKPLESNERTKALQDAGIPVAELYELDAKGGAFDAFYGSIATLKENNPYHASVYVYPEGEYANMRLFLNSDGTAGVALKGDEIVSVFVHPDSKDKGSSQSLIAHAVAQGGKRLDAFDTVLPKIYAKEGFVAVARTPWSDEHAPDGWDKETYSKFNGGEPDVVFMAYSPTAIGGDYGPALGEEVADYDHGVALAKQAAKYFMPKIAKEWPGAGTGKPIIALKGLDEGSIVTITINPKGGSGVGQDKKTYQLNSEGTWDNLTQPWVDPVTGDSLNYKLQQAGKWGEATLDNEDTPAPKTGDLPTGIPEGAVELDKSQEKDLTPGSSIYEVTSDGDPIHYVKGDDGIYSSEMPSGLVATGIDPTWIFTSGAKLYTDGPEAPKEQNWEDALMEGISTPSPEVTSGFKAGDPIKGVEDLDAQSPNTALSYTKKDGTTSKYVKLENGSWLTPGGGVMASIQLKTSANSGKFTIDSIPETNTPDTPQGLYAEGDIIKKYGHLRDMPEGSVITEMSLAGNPIVDFKKQDGEWWSVPNEKFSGSHKISPDELADELIDGLLRFKSGPTDAPSGVLDTQLYPGAPAMSQKDIQDAYIALKNHTSFQVAYGLKALDDKHPLANKEAQAELKIAALNKYPDLKPKPAVMQHLQDALGIKVVADPSVTTEMDSPKIWLGSKTPKEGVQGLDGGEFTTADIQQAVDILENYNGKLFKSELSKKGNPLGDLNPNDLVGFDKDKLVTKQKFTDLLKTKLNTNEELLSHPLVKDQADLKSMAVGTRIRYQNSFEEYEYYTKVSDNQWAADEHDEPPLLWDSSFGAAASMGKLSVESLPAAAPEYAKAPAAVQDKHVDEIDVDNFTSTSVPGAAIGTVLVGTDGKLSAHKIDADSWEVINTETGQAVSLRSDKTVMNWLDQGTWELKQQDGPQMNSENGGLTPGKYMSGGKAYMVVDADGSGVYVNTKGDVQKLTAKAVKSNYDKGMNKYQGVPDNVPTPTKKEATKAKPKAVGDIADGIYFTGNPTSPKTEVYEITGDSVKVFKPSTVPGYKVGQKVDSQWANQASTGASFITPAHYQYSLGKTVPETKWTKGSDGLWHPENTETFSVSAYTDISATSWDTKIKSHGISTDPVIIPKKKVNTFFSQGKFVDSNGNSVVPEGYSGAVSFFGAKTTIPAMLNVKTAVNEKKYGSFQELAADIQAKGLYFDKKLFGDFTEKNYGTKDLDSYIKALNDSITDLTKGLDTDIPESDAADLFEWNSLGEPKIPLEVASLSVYTYDVSSSTAYIKEASKAIGGGKIIGQHYTKMDKYDKGDWVDAFKAGNFKKMYALEVSAAAKDGKAHNAGYLHPGYEGNKKTNQINWGAAVDGEISALADVPGNWSSAGVPAPMAEVDNYLIKAQMQNPTFLSNAEKRSWVQNHRAKNKAQVDNLSATAALRNKEGAAPLSDPLVWDDDVKPAKSYDSLFDDTQFPGNWSNQQATDFYNDSIAGADTGVVSLTPSEVEELKAAWDGAHDTQGYYAASSGVGAFFQSKKEEEEAKALIPVYTMEPNQTVQKSTHPVFNYTDQFGKKYFFKPRPNTKLDKYRSEVEHLGNQFGRLFGFSTADSKLVELDGKYGQLQADVGGVADLLNYDYSTLTPTQIADIGNEHMLDWFLDNDDSKGDNAKILPNGRIVGIDKGRAFKHFGAWKGLSADSSMNSNAHTIYSQLFDSIRSGKLKKEDVDVAYLAIQNKAGKMSKVFDQKITDMLTEGMVNRESYDINYSIDGKKVPQTFEGLNAAVLDRKNRLPQQIEEMWAKVYKDAGFGDLPEKPNNPLGDVISGFNDPRLHEQVFQAEVSGKTAMIGGSHVIGGTALMWTDENTDGVTNLNGEMFLGPKKQKEMLDYFISNATDLSGSSSAPAPQGFSAFDKYGDSIIGGAKTINQHAGDKNYNEEKVTQFQEAKKNLESDLTEWSSSLQSNTSINEEPAYKFKSGTVVPMQHLPQYKLMLGHYQPQAEKIQKAYETNGKTEVISKFTPLTLSKGGEKYVNSDGSTLTKLVGADSYLYVDENGNASGLTPYDINWPYVADAQDGAGGWSSVEPAPDEKPTSGITIVKLAKTHEQNATIKGHKKIVTGTGNVSGSSGQEYEVTLPTGEKIYFRNSAQTNTKRGQHGKLIFRAEGVGTPEDSQAAMDRIMTQLEAMGVGTEAADHNNAELTYWREMYGVLENRKHESGSKYAKASAKLNQKIKEIGGPEEEFLENLSEKLDSDSEIQFWRELYSEFWPDEVGKLIAEEGYLPKFDHQNLQNPELETGKPYWERFDVSLKDIYAQNKLLASATGNDPTSLVLTGGSLSAEERLRQADQFNTGWSASSDQSYGSSHNIYTRVITGGFTNYNAIFDPRMMLRTRTYSFNGDNYGNLANRKTGAPSDPLHVLKNFSGGSNETMLPHMATILDGVELYAFDYADKRNEAIQHLKKLGIESIRGLPIEDRLVMRSSMNAAIDKIKKTWQEKMTP